MVNIEDDKDIIFLDGTEKFNFDEDLYPNHEKN